jgi:futalosine hydrolase
MKLLLTSPTWREVKPMEETLARWESSGYLKNHLVQLSVTGIGGAATSYHLTKLIAPGNWDLVIQLGVCGSFDASLSVGTVVNTVTECFADLGAEDGDEFLDPFALGLLSKDKFPFSGGMLRAPLRHESKILSALPAVKGISVNTVHGSERSIEKIRRRFQPQTESMEGAAFFYCCLMESVPFAEIRCVSNMVERRDTSQWNLPLAITNLNSTAERIVHELLRREPDQ